MNFLYDLLESDINCYNIPRNLKARRAKLTLSKKKNLRKSLKLKPLKTLTEKEDSISKDRKVFLEMLTDDSAESEAEELNRLFLSQSKSNNNEMETLNESNLIPPINQNLSSTSGIQNIQVSCNNIRLEISDSDVTSCSCDNSKHIECKSEIKDSNIIRSDPKECLSENKKLNEVTTDDTIAITISDENLFEEKNQNFEISSEKMNFFNNKENPNNSNIHKENENIRTNELSNRFSSNDPMFEEINVFLENSRRDVYTDIVDEQSQKMKQLSINNNSEKQDYDKAMGALSQGISNLEIKSPQKTYITPAQNQKNTPYNKKSIILSNNNNDSIVTLSTDSSSFEEEQSAILVSDSDDEIYRTQHYENHVSDIMPTGKLDSTSTINNFKLNKLNSFLKDCEAHPHEYHASDTESVDTSSIMENNSIEIPETSSEADTKEDENKHVSIEIEDSSCDENENRDSTQQNFELNENKEMKNSEISEQERLSKNSEDSPVLPNNDTESIQTMNNSNSSSEKSSCEEINIAAKINIKIQFTPNSIKINNLQSEQNSFETEEFQEKYSKKCTPKDFENIPLKEPALEHVDENAQKILNELYGTEWQTPKVIKNLSNKYLSSGKKLNENEYTSVKTSKVEIFNENECVDNDSKKITEIKLEEKLINLNKLSNTESILNKISPKETSMADFTLFHKNIKPELESTRIDITPKKIETKKKIYPNTEAKVHKKPITIKTSSTTRKPTTRKKKTTKFGRQIREPIRCLDSDTYISDDNSIFETDNDEIWDKSDSEIDSEIENDDAKNKTKKKNKLKKSKDDIVYLDLTHDLIEVRDANECASPAANYDPKFNEHLQNLLKTCTFEKKKMESPLAKTTKTKRKLFTPNFGDEDENALHPNTPNTILRNNKNDDIVELTMPLPSVIAPPINKRLESVKIGTPIFKLPTSSSKKGTPNRKDDLKTTPKNKENLPSNIFDSPRATPTTVKKRVEQNISTGVNRKTYGFLKSLGVEVPRMFCNLEALIYRDNYKTNKTELTKKLYDIYNKDLFDNKLDCPIKWNKKLTNTAGRCINKKKLNARSSSIELSDKVLTSADRLRCTLIHELCHAATWILNGEHGHGATWKSWANKANNIFPELPKIGVCHQYDIEYKYTYKCTLCKAKSHAHSKSKKVENIRCSYCHGAIEIFLNKKDKNTGIMIATPVREPTGFAKFVQEKYKVFKTPNMKHADVMRTLSTEFSNLNVQEKSKY